MKKLILTLIPSLFSCNLQDLNQNVAATFYWEVLNRSVRIEGYVEKLSVEESTRYFHSRPVPSQIAACVSYQSTPIQSRDVLCERESVLEAEYMIPGKEVPKPDYWYVFCIKSLVSQPQPHMYRFFMIIILDLIEVYYQKSTLES